MPILKYGVGYHGDDDSKEEDEVEVESRKNRARTKLKKKALWEIFVEEGTNYPYTGNPKLLVVAREVISGFEIFTEYVNGVKIGTNDAEVIVEELLIDPESKEYITAPELKDVVDQEKELDFETYVLNSIMDVFYDDLDVSFANLFETNDVFLLKLMQ